MIFKNLPKIFIAVFALAVIAGVGALDKAGKTTSTNVTTVVHDQSSAAAELLMRSDDFNGTAEATYTTGSITNGEWELNLLHQSVRMLWITPNEPVGSEPAGPPAGFYSGDPSSRCFDQSGNTVPLANVVTSSGNCKLGVNFDSGGTEYKLLMSPFPFSGTDEGGTPSCPSAGCPATGFVTVTCNKVSNNECVSWTIVPNTTAASAGVANLYRFETEKGKNFWVFIGQYNNTFRIDVTNP